MDELEIVVGENPENGVLVIPRRNKGEITKWDAIRYLVEKSYAVRITGGVEETHVYYRRPKEK